jgi:aminoglycoside phosphotransferase (APT) family kinase protein
MSAGLIGIRPAAVEGWMEGLRIGARPPLTFARIGAGASNLTYLATDADDRRWVLRRPPTGELLASAHDVAREFRILERVCDAGVPVPRPLALSRDPAVCDAPLVLMEHVEGVVIDDDEAVRDIAEPERHAISLSLARALADVHAVDLDATGLSDLASHAPYAARQLKRWLRQWEGSKTRELPAVEQLHERLAASAPVQHEVALVHGDFHLLNAIADPHSAEVVAILDWELSTLGDPLADLGGLLAYWPQAGDDPVAGPFRTTVLPGFATRRELAEAYAARSGRDLAALPFWEALAGWKIAVIIEGVRRRQIDRGQEPMDPAIVDGLLERAGAVADEAGL